MQHHYTTPRLDLTPLGYDDTTFVIALLNTPGWLAYIGDRNVHTEEDARAYVKRITENPNVQYWVVREKGQPEAMGIVTYLKRETLEHHDIGFAFLPQYSGQGFAYEATLAMLEDAMREEQMMMAITVPENKSSIRLLERLGLKYKREMIDDTETVFVYGISADEFAINQLIASFFRLFTNKKEQPDLSLINDLCIPETVIIKKTGLTETIYGLETFIEPRRKILTDGTLTDFEEKQITGHTTIVRNIAQHQSFYKKTGILDGKSFEEYGNKFFQLIRTTNGWKINALIWEDE